MTARLAAAARRVLRPRHTVWPTRDGWWCLFAALGLGLAAVNTGNNLVYLLCSMLLALVVVSGLLSEQSLRGLAATAVAPDEVFAGRPALFGALVRNEKRRLPSYAVGVEVQGARGVERTLYLPRLVPGGDRLCTWEAVLPSRGRRRLPGVRLATRFPFGLFVKTGRVVLAEEILVYPAIGPVPAHLLDEAGAEERRTLRRRGRGQDLYDLRPYRPGDDPRLIHWRSTAKTQELMIRELEEETARDTRIVLDGTGAADPERLERGLSEAASLVTHLIRSGAAVELRGARLFVPLGRGAGQARRALTALAMYDPAAPAGLDDKMPPPPADARIREIHVALG